MFCVYNVVSESTVFLCMLCVSLLCVGCFHYCYYRVVWLLIGFQDVVFLPTLDSFCTTFLNNFGRD